MSEVIQKNTHKYRPDIDGLRAIAVLSVLLYHVGFDRLSGGFVGVDIFFVISGFLITKLLMSEYERSGNIDFKSFYIRRSKRLLPALFFTLIVSTIVAALLFTPQRLVTYGGSMIHSVLSFSNVYFFFQSGYFDVDSGLKPLLHTWSLGVEEQFYLIWPLLVLAICSSRVWGAVIYFFLGVASLVFTLILIDTNATATFFLMPFRIVEFAFGAFLASIKGTKFENKLLINIIFILGLALIVYSILSFDKQTQFPGWNALIPCLGTAMCIFSGRDAGLANIIKIKPMVWLGLLSYSLYLVHWPIVVFVKYYFNIKHLNFSTSVIIVIACLSVASFMYYFIEKPLRKIPQDKNGKFFFGLILAAMMLLYTGASMWATSGWAWRPWMSNSISVSEIRIGKELRFKTREKICTRKTWERCDQPIPNKINALIIGDSQAVDGLNAFYHILPSHDYSMSELGGCPPHKNIDKLVTPSHPNLNECKALNLERHDIEKLKQFDYIVINVLYGWYSAEQLKEYLSFLKTSGINKVIIMGGYITLTEELPEIINKNGFVSDKIKSFVLNQPNENVLKQYSNELGYLFLSTRSQFCQGEACTFFNDKKIPFTYDKHHLSFPFATKILQQKKHIILDYITQKDAFIFESPSVIENDGLKILNWGPRAAPVMVIPNIQPDGTLGIWVKVTGLDVSENWHLSFDGEPALLTNREKGLITASVNPNLLKSIGEKAVTLENRDANKVIDVGVFMVK